MDEEIRRLERLVATGDYAARQQWRVAVMRAGYPDPDEDALGPLTEWEEIQKDYDEIFWHRTKALRFGWDMEPRAGICKAHHTWGHRGWNPNSKRKTVRTHRNGSRNSFKIRYQRDEEVTEETPHERRRKKRFGGKEHRKRKFSYNKETERWGAWWEITKPDLDD